MRGRERVRRGVEQGGVGRKAVERASDPAGAQAERLVEAVVRGQLSARPRILKQLESDEQRLFIGSEEPGSEQCVVFTSAGE